MDFSLAVCVRVQSAWPLRSPPIDINRLIRTCFCNVKISYFKYLRPVVVQERCKCDWLWVRSSNMYLNIFIFSFPRSVNGFQNSVETEERSVLTLGSLCLPWSMRDRHSVKLIYFICFYTTIPYQRCRDYYERNYIHM